MIAVKCCLDWAKSQGYINEIPVFPVIKLPRKGRARGRALSFWEFCRLLVAVKKVVQPHQIDSWQRLLIGLWLSGLRLAEASALSWDDPDSPRISFAERFPTLEIDVDDDKGRSHRLMPITADFARWLGRTPKDECAGPIFRPIDRDGNVITNESNLSRTITAFGEAAGIVVNSKSGKFASAQDLRRTYGTRWATRVHPLTLKEMMRHASLTTTEEYYIGINTQAMAETIWNATPKKVTNLVTPDRES
jgi:integrase